MRVKYPHQTFQKKIQSAADNQLQERERVNYANPPAGEASAHSESSTGPQHPFALLQRGATQSPSNLRTRLDETMRK